MLRRNSNALTLLYTLIFNKKGDKATKIQGVTQSKEKTERKMMATKEN